MFNVQAWAMPPVLWRMLAALVLGILLARWSWVLFAPHAEPVFATEEFATAPESGRVFGMAGTSEAEAAPQGRVLNDVRLVGVFSGKPGFAVLELDGKRQVGVVLGDEVAPGTRLSEITANYVVLERGGIMQRVSMEENPAAILSAKAAAVPVVRAPVVPVVDSVVEPQTRLVTPKEAVKIVQPRAHRGRK